MDARDLWESLDVLDAKAERAIDQTVDHKLVCGWINGRYTCVMPLEMQVGRGNGAGKAV
jgi:hypothetical protein